MQTPAASGEEVHVRELFPLRCMFTCRLGKQAPGILLASAICICRMFPYTLFERLHRPMSEISPAAEKLILGEKNFSPIIKCISCFLLFLLPFYDRSAVTC